MLKLALLVLCGTQSQLTGNLMSPVLPIVLCWFLMICVIKGYISLAAVCVCEDSLLVSAQEDFAV